MRRNTILVLICLFSAIFSTGCIEILQTEGKNKELTSDKPTVETVRKEIKKGMVREDVIEVLGPNINILQDEKGRAAMIYDRIPATSVQLDNSDRDTLVLLAPVTNDDQPSSGPKTFTIIIRFDRDELVNDFVYYPSMF